MSWWWLLFKKIILLLLQKITNTYLKCINNTWSQKSRWCCSDTVDWRQLARFVFCTPWCVHKKIVILLVLGCLAVICSSIMFKHTAALILESLCYKLYCLQVSWVFELLNYGATHQAIPALLKLQYIMHEGLSKKIFRPTSKSSKHVLVETVAKHSWAINEEVNSSQLCY